MWTLSPPFFLTGNFQTSIGTLVSSTYYTFSDISSEALSKLLRFIAVAFAVTTEYAVTALGVTANG